MWWRYDGNFGKFENFVGTEHSPVRFWLWTEITITQVNGVTCHFSVTAAYSFGCAVTVRFFYYVFQSINCCSKKKSITCFVGIRRMYSNLLTACFLTCVSSLRPRLVARCKNFEKTSFYIWSTKHRLITK